MTFWEHLRVTTQCPKNSSPVTRSNSLVLRGGRIYFINNSAVDDTGREHEPAESGR